MKIKKSSWNYRVAELTTTPDAPSTNRCTFWWQVLLGWLVMGIVTTMLGGSLAYLPLTYIENIVPEFIMFISLISFATVCSFLAFASVLLLLFSVLWLFKKGTETQNPLAEAYRAWKEKICYKIDFED